MGNTMKGILILYLMGTLIGFFSGFCYALIKHNKAQAEICKNIGGVLIQGECLKKQGDL